MPFGCFYTIEKDNNKNFIFVGQGMYLLFIVYCLLFIVYCLLL